MSEKIKSFLQSEGNSSLNIQGVELVKKSKLGEEKSYIRASYEETPGPAILVALAEIVKHLEGRKAYLTHDRRSKLPLLVVMS
jgi:hypothetical protein